MKWVNFGLILGLAVVAAVQQGRINSLQSGDFELQFQSLERKVSDFEESGYSVESDIESIKSNLSAMSARNRNQLGLFESSLSAIEDIDKRIISLKAKSDEAIDYMNRTREIAVDVTDGYNSLVRKVGGLHGIESEIEEINRYIAREKRDKIFDITR